MSRKLLTFLMLLMFSTTLFASGTTGKIVGVVTDKQTGEPLPGVNVILDETRLGASTDLNGYYAILNVPVGDYNVRFSFVGYQEVVVQNIHVSVDLTSTVNYELTAGVMELGEAITIVAERPLIRKDETNTVVVKSAEEIANMAVRGVSNITALTAGVVSEDNSATLNVRGGRGNETAYIIDGVLQNNPLDGTFAGDINNNSIEELMVQTGGFNAEYGRVMSGMVNITTKSGSKDYHVMMETITDYHPLHDALGSDYYGYNDYNISLSGPFIPGSNKYTFYGSLQRKWYQDRNPSWIQREWDDKWEGEPRKNNNDQGTWNYNAKLLFNPIDNLSLRLSALVTDNEWDSYIHSYSINNEDHNPHSESLTQSYNLSGTYTLGPKTFFDMKLSYFDYERATGDGKYYDDLMSYGRKDLNPNISAWGAVNTSTIFPDFVADDRVYNLYEKENTGYLGFNFDLVHQIGENHTIKGGFDYQYHTLRYYETRPAAWYQNATDDGTIVNANGVPVNQLSQAEQDAFWYTRHRALSHTNTFGYDVWGDEVGGGDYGDWFGNKLEDNAKNPIMMSAYIQDKAEFDDLILNFGLRMDYLDANDWAFKDISQPFGEDKIFDESDVQDSDAHLFLAPRLGFSFPVSEKTVFHAQYGKFYQMPNLLDLYAGRLYLENLMIEKPWFDTIGNPNLEPEKTTSYEVGLKNQVADNLGVNVTVFYKETSDLIQTTNIRNNITDFGTFENGDFGSVKGVDLIVNLRRTNNLAASLNYTLSWANGTGSASNTSRTIAWLQETFPSIATPLEYDQRHTGSLTLDYRLPENSGPTFMGMKFLQNTGVNVISSFSSGRPYTLTQLTNEPFAGGGTSNVPLTAINSVYTDWNFRVDLKVDKTFKLPVLDLRANAYMWIVNLFDRENVRDVYGTSGLPSTTGYAESEAGAESLASKVETDPGVYSRYKYREQDPTNWGVPRMVRFGLRLEM